MGGVKAPRARQRRAKRGGRARALPRRVPLERQLADLAELHDAVMSGINEGVYDWNVEQGTIRYSERVMQAVGLPRELIDAASLLWRLYLAGYDVGARFAALAARWEPYAEDTHCAFNDLHAMMSFVGAGRWDHAERLLAAQARRVTRPHGANHDMTRLVGLPASRALAAYGRQDYAQTEALLRALPPVAHRIGGSHAQRDVLQLTRAAAAQRRPKKAA